MVGTVAALPARSVAVTCSVSTSRSSRSAATRQSFGPSAASGSSQVSKLSSPVPGLLIAMALAEPAKVTLIGSGRSASPVDEITVARTRVEPLLPAPGCSTVTRMSLLFVASSPPTASWQVSPPPVWQPPPMLVVSAPCEAVNRIEATEPFAEAAPFSFSRLSCSVVVCPAEIVAGYCSPRREPLVRSAKPKLASATSLTLSIRTGSEAL